MADNSLLLSIDSGPLMQSWSTIQEQFLFESTLPIGFEPWPDVEGMQYFYGVPAATRSPMTDVWSTTTTTSSCTSEYSNPSVALPQSVPSTTDGNEYEDHVDTSQSHQVLQLVESPAKLSQTKRYSRVRAVPSSRMRVCTCCQKQFSRPSSLKVHMRRHTGSKPFGCPVPDCNMLFPTNSNANRHIRRIHGTDALEKLRHSPSYYGSQFRPGYEKLSTEISCVSNEPYPKLRWLAVNTSNAPDRLFVHSSLSNSSC